MNFGQLTTMADTVLRKIRESINPIPKISYNSKHEILYFNWDVYDLAIIIHSEGIIITDKREPQENLLEYHLAELNSVLRYQLEKLEMRISMSDPVAENL